MNENPYLESIHQTLPRVLALFDRDKTSTSLGMGDRYYWAWGLIDFGNGTFQGATHGMARLWKAGFWPYATPIQHFLARIDTIFQGTARLTRSDGSLEEAFPNEGSFCVTALVAFDLLCAIDLLFDEATREQRHRWLETVRPMIGYLHAADETHALISNHLATAAATLVRWHALTGERSAEKRAHELLERILHHQSAEGWFKEYDGADPGYQSLCTYYLADIHKNRPDWNLLAPLAHSIRFLWHFAHPDGSFGGAYGSRCTRFYYPAGIEALAPDIPEAAALAEHMAASIVSGKVVSLVSMDEPNLIPMFNAYCWAAALYTNQLRPSGWPVLPALYNAPYRKYFSEAGLLIDSGSGYYTIISSHKGGVVSHFCDGRTVLLDNGIVVRSPSGKLGSTQAFMPENPVHIEDDVFTVEAAVCPMPKLLPTPFQFILLRILSIVLFRFRPIREWTKQLLVKLLITRTKKWNVKNIRRITLGKELIIQDTLTGSNKYTAVENPGEFIAIHMASQGYWQIQDEESR